MSDQHSRGMLGCYGDPIVQHAESRPSRRARHALHLVLDPVAGLHSGACLVRDRQVHPSDRFLGQRRSLRRLDPELAPPAARRRPSRRLDRQAALPLRRRRLRLLRIDRSHARGRGQGRPDGPDPRRPAGARRGLQDGAHGRARASRPTPSTIARSPRARRSGCARRRRNIATSRGSCSYRSSPRIIPLTAPPEHFYRYFDDPKPADALALRSARAARTIRSLRDYAAAFNFDDYFETGEDVRRAVAGYYGLCSFMDEQAGKVLDALCRRPAWRPIPASSTPAITATRSASAGCGESRRCTRRVAGVPLIVAGDGIPPGRVIDTVANLVDIYPFIIDCVGEGGAGMVEPDHPGVSIARLAHGESAGSHRASANITAWARPPAPSRSATAATSTSTTWRTGRSCSISRRSGRGRGSVRRSATCRSDGGVRGDAARAAVPRRGRRAREERQAEQLDRHGGREAVIARGDLGFSPPPGFRAEFH